MRDAAHSSWEELSLGDLVTRLVNGGTPPTNVAAYWQGSTPWITGADFTPSGLSEFRRFVSDEAIRQTPTNVIAKGELLLVTRTGVGKLAIAPCDVAISQDITGVYADRQRVAVDFLYHRMRQGVEDLKKLNQGTSINGIVRNDLMSYRIALPPLLQQQRIAEMLSTVDEAIEQTEVLITKTQQIKAGLMHDLFTRGVTADGELRPPREEAPQLYKDSPLGWVSGEWDVVRLGECVSGIDAGKSPECPDTPAAIDQWGVLKVGAVHPDGLRSNENKVVVNPAFRNAAYLLKDGDLLLSRANTVDLVGLVCHVRQAPPNLMLSDKTLRLRAQQGEVDIRYLFWMLQFHTSRRQIENLATGTSGSMKNISQANVRALTIPRPVLAEQRRIAARLDADLEVRQSLCEEVDRLFQLRSGLMGDLLMGRVPVTVATEPVVAEVAADV